MVAPAAMNAASDRCCPDVRVRRGAVATTGRAAGRPSTTGAAAGRGRSSRGGGALACTRVLTGAAVPDDISMRAALGTPSGREAHAPIGAATVNRNGFGGTGRTGGAACRVAVWG